eukprot:s581_g36.t1
MFVARGFALRRLRTLTPLGDPQSRQQGLLGTASAIAFPQNAVSVLRALPLPPEQLSDYLSIFFTAENATSFRGCKEFVVRRSVVELALRWLMQHNPYYADLQLDVAALQRLPVNGVPDAWLDLAQATSIPLERSLGPADASSMEDTSSASIHAAVIDPGTDHNDPLTLWQTALRACERFEHQQAKPAATCHVRLAQDSHQQLLTQNNHPAFVADERQATSPSSSQHKIYAQLPHSDQPLDSYSPSFWTLCFPCLFPFGDGLDGYSRPMFLPDHDWGAHLLRRLDRPAATHWRRDLDFLAVLYSILHRRRLLRAVRLRVRAPAFQEATPHFCTLQATDFTAVASAIGEFLAFHSS